MGKQREWECEEDGGNGYLGIGGKAWEGCGEECEVVRGELEVHGKVQWGRVIPCAAGAGEGLCYGLDWSDH